MAVSQEILDRLIKARTPKAKAPAKPISKVSEKKKAQAGQEKELSLMDKLFYTEHWLSCPHLCEECGKSLGKQPLTLFFHHALPKQSYGQFRHTHENIIVLCPDCHQQAESDLDKVPKTKKRTEEIKKLLL